MKTTIDLHDTTAIHADLWNVIKDARDDAANRITAAQNDLDRLNALLSRMAAAGMNAHLPTLNEVIASGPWEIQQ